MKRFVVILSLALILTFALGTGAWAKGFRGSFGFHIGRPFFTQPFIIIQPSPFFRPRFDGVFIVPPHGGAFFGFQRVWVPSRWVKTLEGVWVWVPGHWTFVDP
ncbi:MAG: hypothetical protein ACK4Z6_04835 [Candidatus Methylomirabilales bacterium]